MGKGLSSSVRVRCVSVIGRSEANNNRADRNEAEM